MQTASQGLLDWTTIDLVVFDMDGTLYRQRRLRRRMLAEIAIETARTRSLRLPHVLNIFRHCRETLGDGEAGDFITRQYALPATRCGCSPDEVRAIVEEWIERRPLRHLSRYRYPGILSLFDALSRAGKKLAILSDYPADTKLSALGLKADIVADATAPEIGRLKPHPAGLHHILSSTGVSPQRALMIGDRDDRDGEAARRAGVRVLIRSSRANDAADHFRTYTDALFQPLLAGHGTTTQRNMRHEAADAL